jgi:hypothetical protein
LAERIAFDGNVLNHRRTRTIAERHRAADQLRKNTNLAGALFKATHVENSGGQNLAGVNARDTIYSLKNAAATRDFDDQADDDRRTLLAISDDNIAHSTHSVTERVKDRTS